MSRSACASFDQNLEGKSMLADGCRIRNAPESLLSLLQFTATLSIWICGLTNSGQLLSAEPGRSLKYDVHERALWTTSRVHGQPDPPDAYTTERIFPNLSFVEPLSMCPVPGHNKFCVATRSGKIYTFDNVPDVKQAQLLIDLGKTIYGVAFHPNFEDNGYFFVTNFANPSLTESAGAHLSRFCVDSQQAMTASLHSQEIILKWPSGSHNGGCIQFGPDGYLYLSIGDNSGIGDELLTGQDISDLSGSLLRIDVDQPSAGKLYSIPPDNPFAGDAGARGEIWSFGHRHVWKFSFDEQHRLWAGDVGQDLWEAIYLIEKGGNYGWSIREAGHPYRPERPQGPGEIKKPIVEHSHSHFRSVTGGYVLQSDRLGELKGAYIYGDYDTGAIWALKYEAGQVSMHEKLADTQLRIVEFAQDKTGDVYLVDFVGGGIHQLIRTPESHVETQPSFPSKLSETGLFSSPADYVPASGLIPYAVNAPLWSDGAVKDGFIALPGDSKIEMDAVFYPHAPDYSDLGWKFPDGTVLVKTFSMALDQNRPSELHRLETRILHFRQMPGDDAEYGAQVWNGYTYVWNAEQTDATLLGEDGLDRELVIIDPAAPGGKRNQTWHFPSRAECALCHTMGSKYVLGVTTLQLNRDYDYGGHVENQLAVLNRLGVFERPLPAKPEELPALVNYREEKQPLHLRARSYLHANCAHCHRKWGGGNTDFELQASSRLTDTGVLNARPSHGKFGLSDPRILVPGEPERSLVWHRMLLANGEGRMPHIGSNVPDHDAIAMLESWIQGLDGSQRQLSLAGALRPRLPASPLWQFFSNLWPRVIAILGAFCLYRLWWWSADQTTPPGRSQRSVA